VRFLSLVLLVLAVPFVLMHPRLGPGARRWASATDAARGRLAASAPHAADTSASVSVPPPVARYFARVLRGDQRPVQAVTLTQSGEFRMSDAPDSWRPFTATQHFRVNKPGFVWDSRIAAWPMMPVFVRDSYIDGVGGMRASVLGLYNVMDARPSQELNEGALQRYLAEALWFPTALLPSTHLQWEAINDRSAKVTLTDDATTASLIFDFNDTGEVDRVWTSSRSREVKGAYIPTPWEVTCRDWGEHDGMRIPMYCEVSWVLETGLYTYWKGTVGAITFTLRP
jgi:hypothetical protein